MTNHTIDDISIEVFEAYCGADGDFRSCCGAECPTEPDVPCTRLQRHRGDHVAADAIDGHLIARWAAEGDTHV